MLVENGSGKRVLLQPGHREDLAEVYLFVQGRQICRGVALLQFSPSFMG